MPNDLTFDENLNLYRDGTGDFATSGGNAYTRDRILRAAADAIKESNIGFTPRGRRVLVDDIETRIANTNAVTGPVTVQIAGYDPARGDFRIEVSVDGREFDETISV